jgi:hypothetical protein
MLDLRSVAEDFFGSSSCPRTSAAGDVVFACIEIICQLIVVP